MTPTPGPVPDLFPGAPQRVAGLDLHAIAGRPSTTPLLRSYADVPPRARSAPRGAMTLALAPTLARHAEHAPTAGHNQPRHVYAEPVQPCALAMTDALSFHFPAIPTASRNGKPETHRFSCSRAHQLARSCSISRHVLFGHWRLRTKAPVTLDFQEISIASLSTSVGSRIVQREDRARLLAVLRTLPLDQQLLLEMFYWQDLEREQLAEIFDVEVATIGSRLFRARQALCKGLDASSEADVPITDDRLDDWVRTLSDDRPK
jgi:RNA polymerase sigma factor (sigma-70 family)